MGLLSGKYNNKQIPEESRFNQGMGWVPKEVLNNLFFNKISIKLYKNFNS